MARFDVYKYKSKATPLVLDVQADLLSELVTCVVIPLVSEAKAKKEALPQLKPILTISGKNYVLMTTDIGTISRKTLGAQVANIEAEYRLDVTNALDFLFDGF